MPEQKFQEVVELLGAEFVMVGVIEPTEAHERTLVVEEVYVADGKRSPVGKNLYDLFSVLYGAEGVPLMNVLCGLVLQAPKRIN